jgi:hypothetical protein
MASIGVQTFRIEQSIMINKYVVAVRKEIFNSLYIQRAVPLLALPSDSTLGTAPHEATGFGGWPWPWPHRGRLTSAQVPPLHRLPRPFVSFDLGPDLEIFCVPVTGIYHQVGDELIQLRLSFYYYRQNKVTREAKYALQAAGI